jgi:hypothetical protein
MTAVEWLIEQMKQNIIATINLKNNAIEIRLDTEIIEQAEAMFKMQIVNAVNSQRQLGWDEKGEQYYNETYKNN